MLNFVTGGTKIDIVLFLSSLLLREVDILQKFHNLHNKNFVCVLIILVFFEVRHSVLLLIKVVPGKNDYFLHQKIELHR